MKRVIIESRKERYLLKYSEGKLVLDEYWGDYFPYVPVYMCGDRFIEEFEKLVHDREVFYHVESGRKNWRVSSLEIPNLKLLIMILKRLNVVFHTGYIYLKPGSFHDYNQGSVILVVSMKENDNEELFHSPREAFSANETLGGYCAQKASMRRLVRSGD